MQTEIHPKYEAMQFKCSCGTVYSTRSTMGRDINIEICSNCHPFYTGQQRVLDAGGRIEKFRNRYAKKKTSA